MTEEICPNDRVRGNQKFSTKFNKRTSTNEGDIPDTIILKEKVRMKRGT